MASGLRKYEHNTAYLAALQWLPVILRIDLNFYC